MALADRYDLVHLLGEGSFGRVFRARDRLSGRTVAIKVLHRQDDDARRRFHREAIILHSQLGNEFVIELLDHGGLNDGDPYLVLEFCALKSLRSWVGSGRGWRDIATALLHAAKGLARLHAGDGLHRDLKPENLLVARVPGPTAWRVKLADFGLAGFPHPVTGKMTLNACGTQGYIAPELYGGTPFHARADVYSLGIVGVELLTGRIDVAALQVSGAPPGLVALVRSMVTALPAGRPDAQAVVQRLEALLTEARAVAPAALRSAQRPSSEQGGGSGWGWLALAAAGAVVAGTMNTKDANGRFHGSDGKFRSGRWG